MDRSRFSRVTEKQRECLRLIGRGLSAGEVASELGISESAVNERLRAARGVLAATSSRSAARMLQENEQHPYDSPVDRISVVGEAADEGQITPVGSERVSADGLQEAQVPYLATPPRPTRSPFPPPVPTRGRHSNDLNWLQILLWGLGIGFGAVSLLGALISLQRIL